MTKILVLLYGIRHVIYANHTPYAIFIRLDSVVRKIFTSKSSYPSISFRILPYLVTAR